MPIKHICHRDYEQPIETTNHPIRVFDPTWSKLYNGHHQDIFGDCEDCGENKIILPSPSCSNMQPVDPGSIVVSIGSATRTGNDGIAQASFGLFYGPKAMNNDGDKVHDKHPVAKSVEGGAVIAAIICLLRIVKKMDNPQQEDDQDCCIMPRGLNICKILILTDSVYLVKAMNEYIWKWKKNGFKTAKKQPVANAQGLEELDDLLEIFEDRDIPVWFWLVKKEDNQEANFLAKQALDNDQKTGVSFEYDFLKAMGIDCSSSELDSNSGWDSDSQTDNIGIYQDGPSPNATRNRLRSALRCKLGPKGFN